MDMSSGVSAGTCVCVDVDVDVCASVCVCDIMSMNACWV